MKENLFPWSVLAKPYRRKYIQWLGTLPMKLSEKQAGYHEN